MSICNEEIAVRIVVVNGPQGVKWAVQLGRVELLAPARLEANGAVFEFMVHIDPRRTDVQRFTGAAVQGKTGAQFIYVNSGTYAGQSTSCWGRRAKVSLAPITAALLARYRREGGVLEARFFGVARDGGPACASVPLLDEGWRLVAASPA